MSFFTISRLMDLSALFTMCAFLPEAQLLYNAKTNQDITGLSLPTGCMYIMGKISWILYGFFVKQYLFSSFQIGSLLIIYYCTFRVIMLRYNIRSENNNINTTLA